MSSNTMADVAGDDEALDWARDHAAFGSAALLRNSPWARTYRLSDGPAATYLKILPDHQAPILGPAALLAEHFPRHVPRVIASNVDCGWMLSADHEGRVLDYDDSEQDLRKLLKTYARFQVEALKLDGLLASLPRPDLSTLPDELLAFLDQDESRATGQPDRISAAYFIGRSESKRYFRTLSRRRSLLKQHLQPRLGAADDAEPW